MSNYKCPGCGKMYTNLDEAIECAKKDSVELKAKESEKGKIVAELKDLKDQIFSLYDEMKAATKKYNEKVKSYTDSYGRDKDWRTITTSIYTSEPFSYYTEDEQGNTVKITYSDINDLLERNRDKKNSKTSTIDKAEIAKKYKPAGRKFKEDEKTNTTSAVKEKCEKCSDIERLKSRYEDLYSKLSSSDKDFIDEFHKAFEKTFGNLEKDDFGGWL